MTIASDPCSGDSECGDGPCHILCIDGCATTPVPAIHIEGAPLPRLQSPALALKALATPFPDLAGIDRPPRPLA